jgi:hypothetical protein
VIHLPTRWNEPSDVYLGRSLFKPVPSVVAKLNRFCVDGMGGMDLGAGVGYRDRLLMVLRQTGLTEGA